jgi:hypothetical protein
MTDICTCCVSRPGCFAPRQGCCASCKKIGPIALICIITTVAIAVGVEYEVFRNMLNWLDTSNGLPAHAYACILYTSVCVRSMSLALDDEYANHREHKKMTFICIIVYTFVLVSIFLDSMLYRLIWAGIAIIYLVNVTVLIYKCTHTDVDWGGWHTFGIRIVCVLAFIFSGLSIYEWNPTIGYGIQTLLMVVCMVTITSCLYTRHRIAQTYKKIKNGVLVPINLTTCYILWLSVVLHVVIGVISTWKGRYSPKLAGIHSICFALSALNFASAHDAMT